MMLTVYLCSARARARVTWNGMPSCCTRLVREKLVKFTDEIVLSLRPSIPPPPPPPPTPLPPLSLSQVAHGKNENQGRMKVSLSRSWHRAPGNIISIRMERPRRYTHSLSRIVVCVGASHAVFVVVNVSGITLTS